jgi:hypothetical protein
LAAAWLIYLPVSLNLFAILKMSVDVSVTKHTHIYIGKALRICLTFDLVINAEKGLVIVNQ